MKVRVESPHHLGVVARLVRKSQQLDQATVSAFAGSGLSFISQFENGKPTVEIGRVLSLFDALGIGICLDLPLCPSDLNKRELCLLGSIMRNLFDKKVRSISSSDVGYVVSQIPDMNLGYGFELRVAWGVESLADAKAVPVAELSIEHSSGVEEL